MPSRAFCDWYMKLLTFILFFGLTCSRATLPGGFNGLVSLMDVYKRALAEFRANDFEAAARDFRLITKRSPNTIEAHTNLGVTLEKLEKYDEAVEVYRNAIDIFPDRIEPYNHFCTLVVLIRTLAAENLRKAPPPTESMELCRKAVEVDPNNAIARHNIGVAAANAFLYDESIPHLLKAYEIDRTKEIHIHGLVTVLGRAPGRCKEAEKWAHVASEQFPTSHSFRAEGMIRSLCRVADKRAVELSALGNRLALADVAQNSARRMISGCMQWKLKEDLQGLTSFSVAVYPGIEEGERDVKVVKFEDVFMEGESALLFSKRKCTVYYNDHMMAQKVAEEFTGLPISVVEVASKVALSPLHQRLVNYYHWLIEGVPRLLLLLEFAAENDITDYTIMLPDTLMVNQTLQLLHIEPAKVHYYRHQITKSSGAKFNQQYHYSTLYTIDWRDKAAAATDMWAVHVPPREMVRRTRETLLSAVTECPPPRLGTSTTATATYTAGTASAAAKKIKVVYVTRMDAGVRKLNEGKLIEKLAMFLLNQEQKPDFLIFMGSNKTLTEQICALRNANVIIGPHGAGLTNMLFAADNAQVILFPMKPFCDRCYQRLPEALGFKLRKIESLHAYYYGNYPDPTDYQIDRIIDEVREAMEEVKRSWASGTTGRDSSEL